MLFREGVKRPIRKQTHKTVIHAPILLIEDNDVLAEIVRFRITEVCEVDVHHAQSFAQAKALLTLHKDKYLVALCDLVLPDARNGEVLDLVAQADVRAIAVTGIEDKSHFQNRYKGKLVDYVVKDSPNALNYIIGLIRRLHKNRSTKALVVDDSRTGLLVLSNYMSLLNFQVYKARDGVEALALLKQHSDIRLLITDYEMPNMDGFQLVVETRKIFDKYTLSIVGVSASGRADIGAMFIKNGANDFLHKPYTMEELICRINMNMDALDNIDYIVELANKDVLTGLYNRRYFFSEIEHIDDTYIVEGKAISCAIIDIDYFKTINDTYGHDAGDEVLRRFSKILRAHFEQDLVARIGGEEFAIISLPEENAEFTHQLERFRGAIESIEVQWMEDTIKLTVSIGVHTASGVKSEAILKQADKHLYHAKEAGRNQICDGV